jgi:hypothetical protein
VGTLEERVAFLEGLVGEHARTMDAIREAIVHLEQRMDARFDAVDRRFEAIDRRFEAIDRRFEAIDGRFAGMDGRFEAMERRFGTMDDRVSRQFMWLVGIQVTTLVAIVAALVAR